MESYKELGNKYLMQNRKRSLITVLGCMIVATALFAFLNVMCCWIDYERELARKEGDYEIVILSDDKDTLEKIVNEDFVRSAYFGKEIDYDDDIEYGNALYINVTNILTVKRVNSYIQNTYGVKTKLNIKVLWTYCLDGEGLGFLLIASGLFITYTFAIIGIGIIRNSVQLSALERIKDYGNLRCIGATKKQVKAIVFRESFILESIGIAGGTLLGYLISVPIALSKDYSAGFHFIPLFMIVIAFNFDLYFAIDDGVKKVLKVSPVEAVKGNYRIRIKKLRKRSSGIWGKVFGVEGDYAYKNIKRNNGRFLKTTGAMAFGLGTVVVIGSLLGIMLKYLMMTDEDYGYYQQYIQADTLSADTSDEMKSQLYSPEAVDKISNTSGVGASKYIYHDTVYTAGEGDLYNHLSDDFLKTTASYQFTIEEDMESKYGEDDWTRERGELIGKIKKYRDSGKGLVDYDAVTYDGDSREFQLQRAVISFGAALYKTNIDLYGYDAEDYARYQDRLIEGTTDLSPNGVLLINQAKNYLRDEFNGSSDEDYLYMMPVKETVELTTYKVGDEITIVDPVEMDKLIQEEMSRAREYDEKHHEKAAEWDRTHKDEVDENGDPLVNPYEYYTDITENTTKKNWIIESARQKLADEGKVKTYVIEGIVEGDPNRRGEIPTLVVPKDKYFEITGQTENDYSGFQFHISNIFSSALTKDEFNNALHEKDITVEDVDYTYTEAEVSQFCWEITYITEVIKEFLIVGGVIFIIVLVSAFNTMNSAISNLELRRNEFAQLRALGMTKRSLLKTVLLEGGIVWIISSILGITIGCIIEYYLHQELIRYIVSTDFYIAWLPVVAAMLLEFIVLCGTNVVVFRNMKLDIATELTRSGE